MINVKLSGRGSARNLYGGKQTHLPKAACGPSLVVDDRVSSRSASSLSASNPNQLTSLRIFGLGDKRWSDNFLPSTRRTYGKHDIMSPKIPRPHAAPPMINVHT